VKHNFETRWIGWAGVSVHDEKGRASLIEALALKVGVSLLERNYFLLHLCW
jgi:hypothetical protein